MPDPLVIDLGGVERMDTVGAYLVHRAMRDRGAEVIYAGGQSPLNPFYWGVYGGSEWSGILSAHETFGRGVVAAGFEPVSTTVLMEADLSAPEPRDPRAMRTSRPRG